MLLYSFTHFCKLTFLNCCINTLKHAKTKSHETAEKFHLPTIIIFFYWEHELFLFKVGFYRSSTLTGFTVSYTM